MRSSKWNKEELTKLYCDELKTMQEIGDIFGVSRQRICQAMIKLDIPTSRSGRRYHHRVSGGTRFATIDEYLQNCVTNNANHNFDPRTVRKYLPPRVQCSECHRELDTKKVNIHHIIYPATSTKDIQILCPSCHKIKHTGGITFSGQISIYNRCRNGESVVDLAKEYSKPPAAIARIIRKIDNDGTVIYPRSTWTESVYLPSQLPIQSFL